MKKILFLVFLASYATAGAQQQFALLGDFRTTGGSLVKDCKVGYRIVGRLNAEKSNAVLWPTWFGGTSEELVSGAIPGTLDTAGLCVIAVDALGNGISSSPSNTPDFPDITVRDMVNSEYELLTNHLKNVVKARVLVIAAKQDHMVNPASSVAFARAIGCDLYEPDNDCGHIPGMCEGAAIRALVSGWVKSQSP